MQIFDEFPDFVGPKIVPEGGHHFAALHDLFANLIIGFLSSHAREIGPLVAAHASDRVAMLASSFAEDLGAMRLLAA